MSLGIYLPGKFGTALRTLRCWAEDGHDALLTQSTHDLVSAGCQPATIEQPEFLRLQLPMFLGQYL